MPLFKPSSVGQRILACAALGISIFVWTGDMAVAQQEKKETTLPAVSLQVAVVLNATTTELAFTLTNNSNVERIALPLEMNPSSIMIETPNGETRTITYAVSIAPNAGVVKKPPMVKPSESVTWRRNMVTLFELSDLTQLGVYRLYWRLGEWIDDKTRIEYKSNDVYLLIQDEKSK